MYGIVIVIFINHRHKPIDQEFYPSEVGRLRKN
jgi:hypothetical protein